MSDDFQNETRFLGIESSPAFVREPEGNGYIEHFFNISKRSEANSISAPIRATTLLIHLFDAQSRRHYHTVRVLVWVLR